MQTRLILILAAALLALTFVCGATTGTSCYSTFPGYSATIEAQHVYATVQAARK